MPIVGIATRGIRRALGTDIDSERLVEAVDRLGCDVEELARVDHYECPACGTNFDRLPREDAPRSCDACGYEGGEPFALKGNDEMVRLDLLPARPDLFNAPGLCRALAGYLGIRTGLPDYSPGPGAVVVAVDPAVREIRPYIACAEVEMPPLDREVLVVLFRLQEDLHWGVGRDRRKASIGVYDLATHTERIRYTAKPPDYRFTPLGMPGREMSLAEILDGHPKGRGYRGLLEGFDRYPILVDSAGQVLSMPPIINSEETKVKPGSERMFIDVTGTDRRAVEDSLALLVSDLGEMGATVRTVTIDDAGESRHTPDLAPSRWRLSPERTAGLIGVDLDRGAIRERLGRMRHGVEDDGGPDLTVIVPRYRVDVKHEVDLIEDVAIAHGYHELPSPLVPAMTVGHEHPLSRTGRRLRAVLAGLGFLEVVNYVLTSREEHCGKLRLPGERGEARILNPISVNQTIVRTHLLAGLLASFSMNRTREMPQPLFEIGEVVRAEEERSTQRNSLGIGVMDSRADYALIRSTVDAVAREMGLEAVLGIAPLAGSHPFAPVFLPGRAATVSLGGAEWGFLGEVHPEVLVGFSLDHPVVLAELDVSLLLRRGA